VKTGDKLPDELLNRAVTGLNLIPGTLRDQLGTDATLLVFLRHFGCMFCRETLADIRAIAESNPRFPRPLFFSQGSPTEARVLLRAHWPEARAISDPSLAFYEEFGIKQGGLVRMLGPAVWSAKSRAQSKGHRNGDRSGDIWRLPGIFLVAGDEITWSHEYRHAGDLPDYRSIARLAAAAT